MGLKFNPISGQFDITGSSSPGSGFIKADGSVPFAANQSMGGFGLASTDHITFSNGFKIYDNTNLHITSNDGTTPLLSFSGTILSRVAHKFDSLVDIETFGSASTPTIRFSKNSPYNDGIYQDTTNTLSVAVNGNEAARFDPFGLLINGVATIGTIGDTAEIHKINGKTQSTVGAAGGGSALPATPTGYLVININGTDRVLPYYDKT